MGWIEKLFAEAIPISPVRDTDSQLCCDDDVVLCLCSLE